MDHHVVHFTNIGTVVLSTESGETLATKPDFQRFVAGHQDVYSQIKFFLSDKQRLFDISRNNIRLFRVILDLFQLGD